MADDAHYTTCQFSIEFVVRREYGNLLPRKQLSQLKVWRTLLDAHLLSLIGTSYYAAVVVRQNYDWLSLQIRTENLLAGAVAIVQVSYTVHLLLSDEISPNRLFFLRMSVFGNVQFLDHPSHVASQCPHRLHAFLVLLYLPRSLAIDHVPVL